MAPPGSCWPPPERCSCWFRRPPWGADPASDCWSPASEPCSEMSLSAL